MAAVFQARGGVLCWGGISDQLCAVVWKGVRRLWNVRPLHRCGVCPSPAMHPRCGAYAVTMSTIAQGQSLRMGLELEEVFDNLDATVATERQEQRLQRRLLGEGRERALAVVADALHQ